MQSYIDIAQIILYQIEYLVLYIYIGLALRYLKLAHSYAQPSQNISNKSNTFNLESVVPW